MDSAIFQFIENYRNFAYAIVFLGLVLEGEVTLLGAVFLALNGTLNFSVLLPVAFLGVLCGDLLWYMAGRNVCRLGKYFNSYAKKATGVLGHIAEKNPGRAIFLSKFMWGIHRATLIRIGMGRLSIKKFLLFDFFAALAWLIAITGLAIIFNASLVKFAKYLKSTAIGIGVALFAFLLSQYFFGKAVNKRIKTIDEKMER